MALKLEPIIAAKAKEKEHLRKTTCQKSDKSSEPAIDTKKELAKIAGVSHDTVVKDPAVGIARRRSSIVGGKNVAGERPDGLFSMLSKEF
jgi:hypothetical protein